MPEPTSAASTHAKTARRPRVSADVKELHRRCGVYTKAKVVCRILDAIGWRQDVDLSQACLLEPAAGDGEFVVEAARRLVSSLKCQRIKLTSRILLHRIVAYELHAREAESARNRVTQALRESGVRKRTAEACAQAWILTGDFLLAKLALNRFTHAAGNPPYVRWSKIPSALRVKYESKLARGIIGGDLFLPFLDRTLDALISQGRCGFICSDRWRYMAFAERFREKWLSKLRIVSETTLSAEDAFTQDVDSYPTIMIAVKQRPRKKKPPAIKKKQETLGELGYAIKVGPALGHTRAFVLERDEHDVEEKLLRPWVDGSEIQEGAIKWRGRRVITMYGNDGKLIDLEKFPKLKARLQRFKQQLKKRSVVRAGAEWYTTIDRTVSTDWKRPKILIPELAKVPRAAIDRAGRIPSHGVYAIFAPDNDVDTLYRRLHEGKLAKALNGIAPKVKGGYVRCYKRFLSKVVLDVTNSG